MSLLYKNTWRKCLQDCRLSGSAIQCSALGGLYDPSGIFVHWQWVSCLPCKYTYNFFTQKYVLTYEKIEVYWVYSLVCVSVFLVLWYFGNFCLYHAMLLQLAMKIGVTSKDKVHRCLIVLLSLFPCLGFNGFECLVLFSNNNLSYFYSLLEYVLKFNSFYTMI